MADLLFDSIQILNSFSLEEIERLKSFSFESSYTKGAKIIEDMTSADRFFIIQKGSVKIEKNGIPLSTLESGKHFGLMALIDGSPRSADVITNEDTVLRIIPFAPLKEARNNDLYQKILINQLSEQQNQVRRMTDVTVAEIEKSKSEKNRADSIGAQSQFYETLIKEIHHRVKNNLQMVSSLLYLQSRSIKDPDAKNAILASKQRVESLALIHKSLYQRETLAELEMKSYITQLSKTLVDTFQKEGESVTVNINMNEIELNIEKAIPVGLIINELITNSLKYAFEGKAKGNITIKLSKVGNRNQTNLEVRDNGKGSQGSTAGFGSELIKILARQIEATIEERNDNGYQMLLTFQSS